MDRREVAGEGKPETFPFNRGIRKNFHQFSGWAAASLFDRWLVDGNRELLV
jgi:hypothetical protein